VGVGVSGYVAGSLGYVHREKATFKSVLALLGMYSDAIRSMDDG